MVTYWIHYVDEREMVVRCPIYAENDREALRVARAEVAQRREAAVAAYLEKGIRLRVHHGRYRVLILMDETHGRLVYPKN